MMEFCEDEWNYFQTENDIGVIADIVQQICLTVSLNSEFFLQIDIENLFHQEWTDER